MVTAESTCGIMSYYCHHAIIVSSSFPELLRFLRNKILGIPRLVLPVSNMVSSGGYESFLVGPDGGKEGRSLSNSGNQQRDKVVEILSSFVDDERFDEDDIVMVEWAECKYGDEAYDNKILRASED